MNHLEALEDALEFGMYLNRLESFTGPLEPFKYSENLQESFVAQDSEALHKHMRHKTILSAQPHLPTPSGENVGLGWRRDQVGTCVYFAL